jgi:hypothetical protein
MAAERTLAAMLVMVRTHRMRHDLAWLPREARRTSRLIRTGTWAAVSAGAVGAAVAMPVAAAMLWKLAVVGGASTVALGERAARVALRRQIARMAAGELALADLDARPEGELVLVRGTIELEPEAALRGLLIDAVGVYRRVVFQARGTWVHEAATDFTLVDDRGVRIRIEAAGARWLTPERDLVTYPGERFARDDAPAKVRQLVAGRKAVEAIERVLPIGAQVQIVGYKTTTTDATGTARDYRLPPQRATLQSGPHLPLVIVRTDEAAGRLP